MAYSLGIDLGTTYSAAATMRGDRLEIFQLGERAATIPSVVVLRADGEVLTGDAAERRALSEPTRTAREFKRRLGDPTPLILGGTPYGAEALLAHLLAAIVRTVTEQQGEPPASIVLCHPASYGAYKIDLLRQAVRLADVEDVTLLSEPEAAALHYATQERVADGDVIAVYDFGGGTFDASVLRKSAAGFELLGRPEGMERLGGIDFDEALFRQALDAVRTAGVELGAGDPAERAALARLRDECCRAKEALSSDTDTTIQVYLPDFHADVRITRAEFESMIRPRVAETIAALGRAVRSAGLEYEAIDRILLVGGSSRIPLVGEMVREATRRPVAVDAHPKHAMALGAAWFGGQARTGAPVRQETEPGPVADRETGTAPVATEMAAGAASDSVASDSVASDSAASSRPARPLSAGIMLRGRRIPALVAAAIGALLLVAAGFGLAMLGAGGGGLNGPDPTSPGPTQPASPGPTRPDSPTPTTTPEPARTDQPSQTVRPTPGATTQPVSVPNLVGLTEADVRAALEAVGLVPGERRHAFHPTAPVGQVIDQVPPAGAELLPGEAVAYTLSAGPQPVAVPSLAGLTEAEARSALEAVGLVPGERRHAFHTTAPVGQVIDQVPPAGAELLPGGAVAYTLSSGPRPVSVPSLVGLREADATAVLLDAGLVPGERRHAFHPTAPVGQVIDQVPPAGAELLPGEAVSYTVSDGPQPTDG